MNDQQKRYWFPAKRYGWGWGPPSTWQGWLVLITWIAVLTLISPWLVVYSPLLFALFVVGMIAIILAIAYAKGEPPHWRWGEK